MMRSSFGVSQANLAVRRLTGSFIGCRPKFREYACRAGTATKLGLGEDETILTMLNLAGTRRLGRTLLVVNSPMLGAS